jgi:hypothetical protein
MAFPGQFDVMPLGDDLDAATCRHFESGVIFFYTGKEDGPAYEN